MLYDLPVLHCYQWFIVCSLYYFHVIGSLFLRLSFNKKGFCHYPLLFIWCYQAQWCFSLTMQPFFKLILWCQSNSQSLQMPIHPCKVRLKRVWPIFYRQQTRFCWKETVDSEKSPFPYYQFPVGRSAIELTEGGEARGCSGCSYLLCPGPSCGLSKRGLPFLPPGIWWAIAPVASFVEA